MASFLLDYIALSFMLDLTLHVMHTYIYICIYMYVYIYIFFVTNTSQMAILIVVLCCTGVSFQSVLLFL